MFNNNITEINETVLCNLQTEINPDIVIHPNKHLDAGTLLFDKYEVVSRLEVTTGEADLYICKYNDNSYVAKLYRRELAIKEEVVNALKKVNSPFVEPLYEAEFYQNRICEILPYYKNGSLQGKKFTFEEIKKNIIPSINEGLKVLHSNGIIHKDLKPSNIMLADNNKDVVIIDFGISSVKNDGNTVIMTKIGMTPEYSAPETFKGLYLEESDYYSFGITLFELFCGNTPYKNMKAEDIGRYVAIQKIPLPKDMHNELKDFITALTYYDITNRNDKQNPNRRWTYEEVKDWCTGKRLVIPGTGAGQQFKSTMPLYTFLSKEYTDIESLITAFAENWEAGKKQIFKGLFSEFLNSFNPQLSGYCLSAEAEASKNSGKDDIIFWKLIYKIYPELKPIYWKEKSFESLPALGRDMLDRLWKNDNSQYRYYDSILSEKLLSIYVNAFDSDNTKIIKALESIEDMYQLNSKDKRGRLISYYTMAYMLSGQKILNIEGVRFKTVGELAEHIKGLFEISYEEFKRFCYKLVDHNNNLDVSLESWLIAIGKRKELDVWRRVLLE